MNHHSEFEVEADEEEVIRTSYWKDFFFSREEETFPQEKLRETDDSYRTDTGTDELIVREHIPMKKELWSALVEEMEYLKEQLTPIKKDFLLRLMKEVHVLDGGDYTRLYVTWDEGGSEKTIQYYPPSGNRWSTVIAVLHEMARPLGRDLHRIGETQLTEMFLKTPDYSYQITPIKNQLDYYYFVHGDHSPVNRITREQWIVVRDALQKMNFSGFGPGKYESKHYLKLQYNDGLNKNLEINKKMAGKIREFLCSMFS